VITVSAAQRQRHGGGGAFLIVADRRAKMTSMPSARSCATGEPRSCQMSPNSSSVPDVMISARIRPLQSQVYDALFGVHEQHPLRIGCPPPVIS
jgi:hypothetical protein